MGYYDPPTEPYEPFDYSPGRNREMITTHEFFRSGDVLVEKVNHNDILTFTQVYTAYEIREAAEILEEKLAPGSKVSFKFLVEEERIEENGESE